MLTDRRGAAHNARTNRDSTSAFKANGWSPGYFCADREARWTRHRDGERSLAKLEISISRRLLRQRFVAAASSAPNASRTIVCFSRQIEENLFRSRAIVRNQLRARLFAIKEIRFDVRDSR